MEKLHSIILGEGQPFLILHGFLGMADNWKTLGRRWSEDGYQIHLIDQRNHGRSFHSADFGYDLMAADVNEYCQQHALENIILLGHSMGGKVAMQAAAHFPQLIDKLIIADIAPRNYPAHHGDIIRALESVDFDTVEKRSDADKMLEELIPDFGTRQFLLKSLYRESKNRYGWRFNLPVLGNVQNRVGEHLDPTGVFDKPTLFIRGGKSGYITDADQMLIEQIYTAARLETIPDAGHWLHAESPDEFFSLVNEFLKRYRGF